MVPWRTINDLTQLEDIDIVSQESVVLILKHSTTCSISHIAKKRLEDYWDLSEHSITPYYLDLLSYRPLSQAISERYNVHHESPQILLIKNKECFYDSSHFDISIADIKDGLSYYGYAL